jgi:hypothetical protein
MARIKPVLDSRASSNRLKPKPSKVSEELNWNFNFRFYRQIKFFGFDGAQVQVPWFISLLGRLSDLSCKKLSEFMKDSSAQGSSGYRFHHIDWEQKNIPIQRQDLDWLPPEYKENDTEFPLYQFQISQSNGRVIGFFDENWFFNIILLDPLHNMQPAKSYGYSVDQCSPMACDYTRLSATFETIKSASCDNEKCGYHLEFSKCDTAIQIAENALIHYVDYDTATSAQQLIDSGVAATFSDIFETGIIYLMDKDQ